MDAPRSVKGLCESPSGLADFSVTVVYPARDHNGVTAATAKKADVVVSVFA